MKSMLLFFLFINSVYASNITPALNPFRKCPVEGEQMGTTKNNLPEIQAERVGTGHYVARGFNKSQLSMDTLGVVIKDYEASCQSSDCRYSMPNVVETRTFGNVASDKFYTWTKIKNTKTGTYFSEVLTERGEQRLKIINRMMTNDEARSLVAEHGLQHKPIMDTTISTWDLKEVYDAQNNYQTTEARITIDVSTDSFIINRFPSKVLSNLRDSVEALFKSFDTF